MPPRTPARTVDVPAMPAAPPRPPALPPVPDDADILAALAEWRQVEASYRAAYDAMMEARARLVAVLRAAGVVGFASL